MKLTIAVALLLAAGLPLASGQAQPEPDGSRATAARNVATDANRTNTIPISGGASSVEPNGPRVGGAFQQLYNLLRTNLANVTLADLDHAAFHGLVRQLYPLVTLVTNASSSEGRAPSSPAPHTRLFEGAFPYLRLEEITAGTDKEVAAALRRITSTNAPRGLVLDLRFARSDDYAAATAVAAQITTQTSAPEAGGNAPASRTPQGLPLAILINHHTAGAAETLAATLRSRSPGALLIGAHTAGQAFTTRDFTLDVPAAKSRTASNSVVLRVAVSPIAIPGGQTIPTNGLTPDIQLSVPVAQERAWLQDPYRPATPPTIAGGRASTLGSSPEAIATSRRETDGPGPQTPAPIADPVLARALDLLKTLALLDKPRRPSS